MADCTIIGEVKDVTGTARAPKGTKVTLEETRIPGVAHAHRKQDYFVTEGGTLATTQEGGTPAKIARGAQARLQGQIHGFHGKSGAWVQIPDAATVDINTLPPPDAEPSTSALNAETAARVAAQTLYTQTIDEDASVNIGDALRALILMDTSAGEVTATLQPLEDMEGREVTFKKISDDNTAHVDADAMELIDGRLLFDLEMLNSFVTVVAAGGQWQVVAKG